MTGEYILRTCTVAPLALPDAVKEQARAMAGESDAADTTDRLLILQGAADEIERYCGRAFWRAAAGAARESTAELDVGAVPVELAACPVLPDATGTIVTITTVRRWNDANGAWETAEYTARPSGRFLVDRSGIYEVVSTLLPDTVAPSEAVEACARLFAFRENYRPKRSGSIEDDGTPIRQSGAILRSGAGEILRGIRQAVA